MSKLIGQSSIRDGWQATNLLLSVVIVLLTITIGLQVYRVYEVRSVEPSSSGIMRRVRTPALVAAPQLISSTVVPGSQNDHGTPPLGPTTPDQYSGMHEEMRRLMNETRRQFEEAGRTAGAPDSLFEMPRSFRQLEEHMSVLMAHPLGQPQAPHGPSGFDQMWLGLSPTAGIDIRAAGSNIVITVGLSCFENPDIHLYVTGQTLVIDAKSVSQQEEDTNSGVHRRSSSRHFRRSIRLPHLVTNLDAVSASYSEGVLKIVIPSTGELKLLEKKLRID